MLSPYTKHAFSSCSSLQGSLLNFGASGPSKSNSLTQSLSPTNDISNSLFLRQQNKAKRKGNMQNHTKKLRKRKKSKMIQRKLKKIDAENAIMKKRLLTVQASDCICNMQQHWKLHSNIRQNMQKYKKTAHCPDIIYSDRYYRKKRSMHKSSSLPIRNRLPENKKNRKKHNKKHQKLPKL